jgi:hypothetical protein
VTLKFSWDINTSPQTPSSRGKSLLDILTVSDDNRSIYLKEDDYYFRTFFGDLELTEGIHYWEIIADARTEHELKIGVCKSKENFD